MRIENEYSEGQSLKYTWQHTSYPHTLLQLGNQPTASAAGGSELAVAGDSQSATSFLLPTYYQEAKYAPQA